MFANLTACGNAVFDINEPQPEPITCELTKQGIACSDGTITPINGRDGQDGTNGADGRDGIDGQDGQDGTNGIDGSNGADGQDGADGTDGINGVVLSDTLVLENQCTKVADGIWVQNIRSGEVFDVYSNNQCRDALGEFCDNVEPSFGTSGSVGADQDGGGEICPVNNQLVYGEKIGADLLIRVLDFN